MDRDPLEELGRELRETAGDELRAESEITELETHIARLRRRSLADVATEAMHRGDDLTLLTQGRVLRGAPVFVGLDYLVLECGGEVADVRLDRVVLSVTRRPAGGHRTSGGSRSFLARMREYEQTGEFVRLVAAETPHEIPGRVAVVGSDHVVIEDPQGGETVVPLSAVSYVVRPLPGWS